MLSGYVVSGWITYAPAHTHACVLAYSLDTVRLTRVHELTIDSSNLGVLHLEVIQLYETA